ncbi:MAG: hypothetical protein ABFS32_10720, partial [Bacteroidota bacterium]
KKPWRRKTSLQKKKRTRKNNLVYMIYMRGYPPAWRITPFLCVTMNVKKYLDFILDNDTK